MDERLTELETKLSFAEDQIEALNRTVFRQQEQIDRLQAQLRLLYRRVRNSVSVEEDGAGADPRDEIPPHY